MIPPHAPHNDDSSSSSSLLSASVDATGPLSSPSFCPPFQSNQDYEAYLSTIAPPRELICSITQELLRDPVIASDGHTYERKSLITWLNAGNNNRSPVTNSLLENTNVNNLVPNLVVASMANLHREKLGNHLMSICRGVLTRGDGNSSDERGVAMRIEGLLEAGADPNGRRGGDSNTPLHMVREILSICPLSLALIAQCFSIFTCI